MPCPYKHTAEMDKEKPVFDLVFSQNNQKIFQLAYRIFGDVTEAEDITQEVFLRAYRAYDKFRQEAEIYSWLYRIAVNLCREKIRKKIQIKKYIQSTISLDQNYSNDDGEEMVKEIADPDCPAPLEQLGREETKKMVRETIACLPEKYSEIIILRDIDGLSYEEITKILDISLESVGVRLIRGRKILKEKLKRFL